MKREKGRYSVTQNLKLGCLKRNRSAEEGHVRSYLSQPTHVRRRGTVSFGPRTDFGASDR